MKLTNIPFNEYLKLPDNEAYIYTYSFKFGMFLNKPFNYFELNPIREYTFGQVKDCQTMLEEGVQIGNIPKIIAIFSKAALKHIYQQGVVEVFQQYAYICKQMEDILELEKIAFVRKLDEKELKSGVERFSVYGVYPQLKSYASAFYQTIDWAKAQPYNEAFLELCYQKDISEYQNDYSKQK